MADDKKKRRHIRFKNDPNNLAMVGLKDSAGASKTLMALIINESFSGCCLGMLASEEIKVGKQYVVKVGPLDPTQAVVRWKRTYNDILSEVGFEFVSSKS